MSDEDLSNSGERYRTYWEKACDQFTPSLISYARRLTNGKIYDAEDLMHDTVCRALIYSRDPTEIRNPLSYLLRTMRNIWLDKRKHENTSNMDSLDDLLIKNRHPAVEPEVLRVLENEDLEAQMRVGQGPLTTHEKNLLRLYFQGYKCKEIAEKMNMDIYRTRSELNAVKAKVRYRLKKSKSRIAALGLTPAA